MAIVWVNEELGNVAVCHKDSAIHVVPVNTPYFTVDASSLPANNILFNAWRLDAEGNVTVNLEVAKDIAHDVRRQQRDEAMEPLDKQWTYDAAGAEPLRQEVRDKDALKQKAIDAATSTDELLGALR
ncbi:MAG: hypothetical protein GQ474_07840 [Sulfurimonas sp.]|nr:hypothetical protein [Sulfurimonas sp.]